MKKAVQSAVTLWCRSTRWAAITRAEFAGEGRVPLHRPKANIDNGFSQANPLDGTIGVKCWICRNDNPRIISGTNKISEISKGVIEAMQNVVIVWHLAIAEFNLEGAILGQHLKSK
jgi:hypothetical protein